MRLCACEWQYSKADPLSKLSFVILITSFPVKTSYSIPYFQQSEVPYWSDHQSLQPIPPSLKPRPHISFIQNIFGQCLCVRRCACLGYHINKTAHYSRGGHCSSGKRDTKKWLQRAQSWHNQGACREEEGVRKMQKSGIRRGPSRMSCDRGRLRKNLTNFSRLRERE